MKRFAYILLLALGILFFAGNLFINPTGYSKSYKWNIEEWNIEDTCLRINGYPVAKIETIQEESIIIRPEIKHSCSPEEGDDLFLTDMICTRDTGRLRFSFYDNSIVTLGYRTKLVITECIIDWARKERKIEININSGKARCDIKRLDGFKVKTVKIMTKTVIVEVIASDFLIEENDEYTKIITFGDNHLKVTNLAFLDEEPVTIMDFKSAIFKKDDPEAEVKEISKEEAEKILKDFSFHKPEAKTGIQKEETKDIKKEESEQVGQIVKEEGIKDKDKIEEEPVQNVDLQAEAMKEKDKDIDIKEGKVVKEARGIFVSKDELVEPEALEEHEEPEIPEIIIQEEDPIIIPTDISNEKDEEPILLLEFPGPPF